MKSTVTDINQFKFNRDNNKCASEAISNVLAGGLIKVEPIGLKSFLEHVKLITFTSLDVGSNFKIIRSDLQLITKEALLNSAKYDWFSVEEFCYGITKLVFGGGYEYTLHHAENERVKILKGIVRRTARINKSIYQLLVEQL